MMPRTTYSALMLALVCTVFGGCGILGGAAGGDAEGLGRVDSEFHSAYYRAQVAKIKGDREGAKEALLSCLDADPNAAVVHFELARMERMDAQWTAAMVAVERAVDLEDNNPWYRREYAEIALELGRNAEADLALSWLLENKPEDDVAAMMLLDLRTAEGRYDEAAEVVDVLEREWGPDPEWHLERHRLHLAAGDLDAALEDLALLEMDFPEVVEAPLQRARMLSSVGREAEAETVLRSALDRTGHGRLHLELAQVLTARGETADARVHVRSAFTAEGVPLAEKVNIAWTYIELAEIQVDLQEEAANLIDLLLAVHPEEAAPFELLAALRDIQGDAPGALDALERALEKDPNAAERWLEACQLAIATSQWERLNTLAEGAGALFPNLPVFPYFRGMAFMEQGDDKAAERQLKVARNLIVDRPDFESDVLVMLAQIAHDKGDNAASDEWFELAIEANPQNILALNNYAYYLALRGAKTDQAADMAARVVALSPGDANFEDTYAWTLYRKGDFEEALTWIELALFHEGERPSATVLEHAGDILQALDRTAEAKAKWEAALSAGGDPATINPKLNGE